jgi:hypothetical protein
MQPDHLLVESDVQKTLSCSGNPDQRKITYEIVDVNNQQVVAPTAIREQFQNLSADSCGGSIHATQTRTTVNGAFNDTLTAGCVLSGHSTPCGFTASQQQWQWCDANGTTPTLGIPGALTVRNDLISVGGNITGFTPGYSPPK